MKIMDKLTKVDSTFTVNAYHNGYLVEVGGRNSTDDWETAKIVCLSLDEVAELLEEFDKHKTI
jgi:hypothetical protein